MSEESRIRIQAIGWTFSEVVDAAQTWHVTVKRGNVTIRTCSGALEKAWEQAAQLAELVGELPAG